MNIPTLLSEANVQALGYMLLHFVWQGSLIAAVLAGTRVALINPRLRYAIACTALLAIVLLPLATFLSHEAGSLPTPTPSGLANEIPNAGQPMAATTTQAFETAVRPPIAVSTYEHWPLNLATGLQQHMPEIVLCWVVGVLLLSLRLLGGGWVCHRLKHTGTRPLPAEWQTRVHTLAQRQGIRQGVEVVTSTIAAMPMVVGLFRPVVLIPISTFLGLTQQQLETILAHELAHVRRYDNLVNLLQRLVETLFFFHPAVWWVSNCIRTEREHCCDDSAVADSDPKLYATALATLEELRSPVLAAAATGGPLLARIKRLLAVDDTHNRDGLASFAVAGLASLLVVILLTAVVVEAGPDEEANTKKGDQSMNIMVDVTPTLPHYGTTLVSSLSPLLKTVGRPQWSMAQLQGVIGHAFQFEMHEGGGSVYHDNLDWGLALDFLPKFAQFREFGATKKDDDIDLPALKREAKEAVRNSLQQGVPALVWQPMSLEQKANKDPASSAYCWGLIVGYNEAEETYTVRHCKHPPFRGSLN